MDLMNAAPFTKKPGSREQLFTEVEKEKLLPLPTKHFVLYERKTATVAPDFHIQYDKSFYSVPCKYIRCNVQVKATASEIIIIHSEKGVLATHKRSLYPGQKITDPNHLPINAREYSSWNRETFLSRASAIGPYTNEIITIILASRAFEVQSFRSCLGVLNLVRPHGPQLLEQACEQAIVLNIRSRKGIKAIILALVSEQEQQAADSLPVAREQPEVLDNFYCCHEVSKQEDPYEY